MVISVANAKQMPLPGESVGMIITSPPYNVGLNYDGYDDNMPEDEFREFNRAWLAEAYRVMQDTGRMYAIVSDTMLWWFKDAAVDAGWNYVQKLVWCKPNFVGMAGKITNDWNYMTEDILLFRKGKRTSMQNGFGTTHNYFVEVTPQSNHKTGRIHPAQLPVILCSKLIDRTPGEPVLDPFCGSGSVLKAAKKLGRSYIGFDLVPTVTRKAGARLGLVQTESDLPLFATQEQQT